MGPRPHKPSPSQEVVRGWSMTPSYWYEEWRKERAKVAALEAEALQQTECAHKALKQCDRAEKKLDSMKIMERHADWKIRAEAAEARCDEHEANAKMYGAANGELKDALDEAEAERDNLAAALRHENVNADARFAAMLREAREGRAQAEAENLQLKHDLAKFPPRRLRIAALGAEVERLRWMLDLALGVMSGPEPDNNVAHWTEYLESRWTAREEAGDET